MRRSSARRALLSWVGGLLIAGCGTSPPAPTPTPPPGDLVTYVGYRACVACHANLVEDHLLHAHSQALKSAQGQAPVYPAPPPGSGVPDPPPGSEWIDVAYVVGGYAKAANFVDRDGFLLHDTGSDQDIQYNTEFLPTGTEAGYVPFDEADVAGREFEFDCFRCHVTGAESVEDNGGRRQEGRIGVGGTWFEDGVQCEACHGPGSRHVPNPSAGNINIDGSADACAECHALDSDGDLLARDGFVAPYQQATEVAASPHDGFGCTICHDPHVSLQQDPDQAIRNGCRSCHASQNMARHAFKIFVQGDYVESMNCQSCHMPFATKTALSADEDFTGGLGGRIGDTRTHVMNINTSADDFEALLSPDGTRFVPDADGQVAMTLDYACLRCHNGFGSAPAFTLQAASTIAQGIHDLP